jgi:IclR family KDG regulon transcriptional repressor
MEQEINNKVYSSLVLDKVMQILECFSNETPELRYADLVSRLKLNKSTLYRLLEAMRSYRLVEVDKSTGKYHLGLKLFELGTLAVNRLEIGKYVIPILERLVRQTGETGHLCVLDGSEVIYVSKVESHQRIRIPSSVGRRNPAYCTGVGKAILAGLSEVELGEYLARTSMHPYTKRTITDPAELRKQLSSVRALGYSVDDQEIDEGVRCVGASIKDYSGNVIAGISIAGPSIRITKRKVLELAPFVVQAANDISEQLGYRPSLRAAVQ